MVTLAAKAFCRIVFDDLADRGVNIDAYTRDKRLKINVGNCEPLQLLGDITLLVRDDEGNPTAGTAFASLAPTERAAIVVDAFAAIAEQQRKRVT
jgi:hypothetical protein